MSDTGACLLQEAYIDRYSPDEFLDFYASLSRELHLTANPERNIPVSPVPLLLDRKYESVFSRLVRVLWSALENEAYRRLSAASIPEPLRARPDRPEPPIPFDRNRSIGCLDIHLLDGQPKLIEFMVLPPGMAGIYPGLLARYGQFLEKVLPGTRPRVFQKGADRQICEALMQGHILGGGAFERFAIVDWEPRRQITFGEFQYIVEGVQKRRGVEGVIADPRELVCKGGRVWIRGLPVDRILSRLTLVDWMAHLGVLEEYTRVLRESPQVFVYHPYLWYLGDKASLTLLSNPEVHRKMGMGEEERKILADFVPATVLLADFLDAEDGRVDVRRLLERLGPPEGIVLKPLSSHASKGVVFGPVDTPNAEGLREVLGRIDPADYVAMSLVPPPVNPVPRGRGERETWGSDIRLFVLDGRFVFAGGRVYVGDFTNQTPCRAFAPLFFV